VATAGLGAPFAQGAQVATKWALSGAGASAFNQMIAPTMMAVGLGLSAALNSNAGESKYQQMPNSTDQPKK